LFGGSSAARSSHIERTWPPVSSQKSDTAMPAPVLLQPDNFTPPARTPWGGQRITADLKGMAAQTVGESWEVSVEPDFPSRVVDSADTLAGRIARDPAAWLGTEHRAGRASTALLVKLLDAKDALSVQIHPRDDYEALAPDESGKPESWYVVDRTEGAGLYLGFAPGVERPAVERALQKGDDLTPLLGFVAVEPGDFFVIDAGTPHAIGAGVLLVEPQRVLPGRRGVTYRYYDWNRRYDPAGRPEPAGEPRALHVEHALAVTDWRAPRGEELFAQIRRRAPAAPDGPAECVRLAGPGGLPSDALVVDRMAGTGTVVAPDEDALRAVTLVAGRATLRFSDETQVIERGHSAVIPAACRGVTCELDRAIAVVASAR
jgi:mannose-6-phosphate isomerase